MSLIDFGKKYTGNENPEYGKVLADVLQVKSDTPLEMLDPLKLAHGIMRVEDNQLYKKIFKNPEHREVKVENKPRLVKGVMEFENKPLQKVATVTPKKESSMLDNAFDYADDVIEWGKRGLVKYGLADIYGTEEIKTKPIIKKEIPKSTKANYQEVNSDFQSIGDVNAVNKGEKFGAFYNKFDRNKGFNYIPIANVGHSNKDTQYNNTRGVAHFLLDTDLKNNYQHPMAKEMIDKQLRGENIEKGSTVKDQFVPIQEKVGDKVNIKYKQLSEVKDKTKIAAPLRQYRFTDIDWNSSKIDIKSFKKGNVAALTTKTGDMTHFIFPAIKGGKEAYGKFGGGSVVFLANGKNFAIDFTGSVAQIKETAEKIIENENVKPEDLVIAYHDLGSFSAKPKAKENNTLSFKQWSGFNDAEYTGGGLAFPTN